MADSVLGLIFISDPATVPAVAPKRDEWRRTYYFKMGDVFPADDRLARYVMRLFVGPG
jgi:hypothetical protein